MSPKVSNIFYSPNIIWLCKSCKKSDAERTESKSPFSRVPKKTPERPSDKDFDLKEALVTRVESCYSDPDECD